MIIYIIAFIITIFLCFQMQRRCNIAAKNPRMFCQEKIQLYIMYLLAVSPLVLLAAFRDVEIGKDTVTYVSMFEEAQVVSDYSTFFKLQGEQPIYTFILYTFAHFGFNVGVFLGVLQLMALLPLLSLTLEKKGDVKLWHIITIYCCWFYNDSLNAIRQFIAIGFMITFYECLFKKKKWKTIVCFVIAFGFHSSSILLAVIFYVLYRVKGKKTKSQVRGSILLALLTLISVNGARILEVFVRIGVLPSRYALYVNTFLYHDSRVYEKWTHISPLVYFEILVKMCLILYALIMTNKTLDDMNRRNEYLYNYSIGALIYIIGVFVYHTSMITRVTLFFDGFLFLLLPTVDQEAKLKFKGGLMPLTILFSIFYWIMHIAIINSGWTIPYVFA